VIILGANLVHRVFVPCLDFIVLNSLVVLL